MSRSMFGFILLAVVLSGCGRGKAIDKVTRVSGEDGKMNQAIEKARSTVDQVIAAIQSPRPEQSGLSIKKKFVDRNGAEHVWLTKVTFDGTRFHGKVANDLVTVKTAKFGQVATVEPNEISDWMYIEKRRLVGGYTIRVQREMMTPSERADFDESVPFTIDE